MELASKIISWVLKKPYEYSGLVKNVNNGA